MNKKGFTLVELITTLALASAIIVILINVVLIIKDIYFKYDIKTELMINQANLSRALNEKIKNGSSVTTTCVSGSSLNCSVTVGGTTTNLVVDSSGISFGNYTYPITSGTTIGSVVVTDDSDVIVIEIPITNKLYPNTNFGVNVVYVKG